jgi:hypothetical protein
VLKALSLHLEGIKHVAPDVDNDIEGVDWDGFDLQGKVFRGRAAFGKEAPETMLSILEAPRSDIPATAGMNTVAKSEEWMLLLQGWTKDDVLNPTDPVYALVDVVERRLSEIIVTRAHTGKPLYPASYMLGGLLSSFSYGPPMVRPPTEGLSPKAFFYMPLRAGLATVVG